MKNISLKKKIPNLKIIVFHQNPQFPYLFPDFSCSRHRWTGICYGETATVERAQ